jgi:hypothetical protein
MAAGGRKPNWHPLAPNGWDHPLAFIAAYTDPIVAIVRRSAGGEIVVGLTL